MFDDFAFKEKESCRLKHTQERGIIASHGSIKLIAVVFVTEVH